MNDIPEGARVKVRITESWLVSNHETQDRDFYSQYEGTGVVRRRLRDDKYREPGYEVAYDTPVTIARGRNGELSRYQSELESVYAPDDWITPLEYLIEEIP